MTATPTPIRDRLLRRARRQRLLLMECGADARVLALFLHAKDSAVVRNALVTMRRDDRQAALEVLAAEGDVIADEIGPHALARLVIALTPLKGRDRAAAWDEARTAVAYVESVSNEYEADETVWQAQDDADAALYQLTPHSLSAP